MFEGDFADMCAKNVCLCLWGDEQPRSAQADFSSSGKLVTQSQTKTFFCMQYNSLVTQNHREIDYINVSDHK